MTRRCGANVVTFGYDRHDKRTLTALPDARCDSHRLA